MVLTQIEKVPSLEQSNEAEYERWRHWPVDWTAVAVGGLAVVAASIIFTLVAVAVGVQEVNPQTRIVDLKELGFAMMVGAVVGSFFSFVIGGWVTGKIAGILHSETAMLHGSIVWLVAVPLIALFSAVGAGGYAGSWYSGLSNASSASLPFDRPDALGPNATDQQRAAYDAEWAQYRRDVAAWTADTPRAQRNAAICAISALLIGLMGAVVGGWMASGEPMSVRYRRPTRVV